MMKVDALFDFGPHKTLILENLVQRLGLKTCSHPKPYPLGSLHKDTKLQNAGSNLSAISASWMRWNVMTFHWTSV